MLLIILLVMFTLCMGLWLLSMLGAVSTPDRTAVYSPWLAWFSILVLGIVVFLLGTGVIVVQKTVIH